LTIAKRRKQELGITGKTTMKRVLATGEIVDAGYNESVHYINYTVYNYQFMP